MCLAEVGAESRRPAPAGPPGQQALVDQLCLDIPIDRFDAEADFVARLTGWEHRAGSRPEFDHLLRPPQIPLRLLLQRVAAGGRVGAHLDWACEDVAAEVARHRSQGAEVVRTTSEWTTLRDPAGLEYCLTCRDPSGSGAGVSSTD
jgi:hypothetical protein